jgi:hypothetical protein
VDRYLTDLDARTGDQASEGGGDSRAWVPVERLKHKHTLCQNDRQYYDYHVAPIASVKQLAGRSGVFVVVLHQIPDDQVRID